MLTNIKKFSPQSTTARNGSDNQDGERNGAKNGQEQDDEIKTENDNDVGFFLVSEKLSTIHMHPIYFL